MDISGLIQTISQTGEMMSSFRGKPHENDHPLFEAFEASQRINPWFTAENIIYAVRALGESMSVQGTERWLGAYSDRLSKPGRSSRNVGVVTAGNIPLAGFHDFLCVLASGHRFVGKLSGMDKLLLPAIAEYMSTCWPELAGRFEFTGGTLGKVDAVIATGSGNTNRYFEFYFRNYPHILRRNRNGVALVSGNETDGELEGIVSDIMMYFGLGCRNVSKIYFPEGYDPSQLKEAFEAWGSVIRHNKYMNNYDYRKSILIVNRRPFLDFGNILLVQDQAIPSPVAVLHFEFYKDHSSLVSELKVKKEEIQCIVSASDTGLPFITPGSSQFPALTDYADGVDTMDFLLSEI
jgi:hypothetical protein